MPGGLSLGNLFKSVTNPGQSIIDDLSSSNPLQSFLDPANAFGGLLASMPAVPAVPATPTLPVKYSVPFSPMKTNYGSFNTPIMQDVLSKLHPSIRYTPPVVTATPTPSPGKGTGGLPPGGPVDDPIGPVHAPSNGGGGGGGGGGRNPPTQPKVVARPSVMQSYQRQYAQTPNTVITRSNMTVPGTAVVAPVASVTAAASGIKPGLLGGGSAPAAPAVAGAR